MKAPGLTVEQALPATGYPIAPQYRVDVVPRSALPPVPRQLATGDQWQMLSHLPQSVKDLRRSGKVPALPPETVFDAGTWDFEQLASVERAATGDYMSGVIRMGGGYDEHAKTHTAEELERLAVRGMGGDASLYFHGVEQLRRVKKMITMQQLAHSAMREVITDIYGGETKAGERAYEAFKRQVPEITGATGEILMLTGLKHDLGEAALKRDITYDNKTNPLEVAEEADACVLTGTLLHSPLEDERLMFLAGKRAEARQLGVSPDLSEDELLEISGLVHPSEAAYAIYVVENSEQFKIATEPKEYVLSGIRAFENVEYDLVGMRSDPLLNQKMLRLGLSTFYNSLSKVCAMAEKYVDCYDFLRQNAAVVDRYVDIMMEDIANRARGGQGTAQDAFGVNPWANYDQGLEPITTQQAMARFWQTGKAWKKWKGKPHLVRDIWESMFGTNHALTVNPVDVSFLQYSANAQATRPQSADKPVRVKPVPADIFGVENDAYSRAEHEALAGDEGPRRRALIEPVVEMLTVDKLPAHEVAGKLGLELRQ